MQAGVVRMENLKQSQIDEKAVRAYRLQRTRQLMLEQGIDALVLYDPLNLRYATGCRNMQVWTSHHMARYVFIPAVGKVVMFDYGGALHLADNLETIDESRPAKSWDYFGSGSRAKEHADLWAEEIVTLLHEACGKQAVLGLDRADLLPLLALQSHQIEVHDAKPVMELARAIKSDDEIMMLREAMQICTDAITTMREQAVQGVTEEYLLSIMNQHNIAHGGEYQETRLLSSGHRTNPWFNEASDKPLVDGEMLVFDSDLVSKYGMFTDQTRAFVVGEVKPTDEQRRLYSAAYEQLQHNMHLLKAGVSFHEFLDKSWQIPEIYEPNRYAEIIHGIGFGVEYPLIYYPQDATNWQYEGVFEAGMTVCVESYIGAVGGQEGVKLEQPVLITETGFEPLSNCPFEESYL